MKIENSEAEQAFVDSIAVAKIVVGTREFEIPVNLELATRLAQCKPNEKDVSTKMTHFMKWYLTNRELPCNIEINGMEIPFQLPADLYYSLEMEPRDTGSPDILIDDFGAILRNLIPSDMRPATDRQLWFAKRIALTLDIILKEDDVKTVETCCNFIDRNIEQFNENKERTKEIAKQARQACRGYIASTLLDRSLSKEEVTGMMNVLTPSIIIKYLEGYISFVKIFEKLSINIQNLYLDYINELIVNTYEHIDIPTLTGEMVKQADADAIIFPDK